MTGSDLHTTRSVYRECESDDEETKMMNTVMRVSTIFCRKLKAIRKIKKEKIKTSIKTYIYTYVFICI